MTTSSLFTFDNSYARELEGLYASWSPARVPAPQLVRFNDSLARDLGLEPDGLDRDALARVCAGNDVPEGAAPLAQAYAGHQFGGFSPQLGDGRALLLGEVIDRNGRRRDVALKGSGRTPFSRRGDGKAALGPVLREYLMGEGMHALGIPTTRALAAVRTGESVLRDRALPGAVLVRVAASHVRVGTFEFFAAQGDTAKVRRLADYVIARHYPELLGDGPGAAAPAQQGNLRGAGHSGGRYLALLKGALARQATLIAQWMHVGFIHGVMNTDNMALSGETLDYGPCAFMEAVSPSAVFSSIDTMGRYAYGNQPAIAHWNLARFAETLLPLLDDDVKGRSVPMATEALGEFAALYDAAWLAGGRAKLGLAREDAADLDLFSDWLGLLEAHAVDFTLAWRRLADAAAGETAALAALFPDAGAIDGWLTRWRARVAQETASPEQRALAMRRVNPAYIPRNHRVEEALAAAERGDLSEFDALLEVIRHPYDERPGLEAYTTPAPREVTAAYKTFCGT